jgi:hypothetical protein
MTDPDTQRTQAEMTQTDTNLHRGDPTVPGGHVHNREHVRYLVGCEHQQILLQTSGLARDSSRRIPDGVRHAVTVATGAALCGVDASSLFVFDLDWATMLSNEMCPECKRAAF